MKQQYSHLGVQTNGGTFSFNRRSRDITVIISDPDDEDGGDFSVVQVSMRYGSMSMQMNTEIKRFGGNTEKERETIWSDLPLRARRRKRDAGREREKESAVGG